MVQDNESTCQETYGLRELIILVVPATINIINPFKSFFKKSIFRLYKTIVSIREWGRGVHDVI